MNKPADRTGASETPPAIAAAGGVTTVWAFRIGSFEKNPDAGWTHAIAIKSLGELVDALRGEKLQARVRKLAIVAHGDNGGVVQLDRDLTEKNVPAFAPELKNLGDYLTPDGRLIFMSCQAGAGKEGTDLLRQISLLLPGRTVIGFIVKGSIRARGLAGDIWEASQGMTGMNPAQFKNEPRMTEESAFAKWVRDGREVRLPVADEFARLMGNWTVVSAIADGRTEPDLANAAAIIRFDRIEFTHKGTPVWSATHRMDLLKRPRTIDLTYTSGKRKDKAALGILRFGDENFDIVTLCLAELALDRPDDFSAPAKSRRLLIEMQRAPAK